MDYKIDKAKGVKVLQVVTPSVVIINSVLLSLSEDFGAELTVVGFNVLNGHKLDHDVIAKYLAKSKGIPTAIYMSIADVVEIEKKVGELLFTYVWIYPNNAKEFRGYLLEKVKEGVHITDELTEQYKLPDNENRFAKKITKTTKELLNNNITTYADHLSHFDKSLTILI